MIDAVHYNLFEGGCLTCGNTVGFGVEAVTGAEGCPIIRYRSNCPHIVKSSMPFRIVKLGRLMNPSGCGKAVLKEWKKEGVIVDKFVFGQEFLYRPSEKAVSHYPVL